MTDSEGVERREEMLLDGGGACPPIYVARQPIFDRDEAVYGHELLFRGETEDHATITDPTVASANVLVDGLALALPFADEGEKTFIHFTEKLMEFDISEILDPMSTVIEVLENVKPTTKVVEACRTFTQMGYTLAIDDYGGRPGYDDLLSLADIIKVDVLHLEPHEIVDVTQKVLPFKGKKLAEKVEDERTCKMLKALGYDLFKGYYFSRPKVIRGQGLSSTGAAKFYLLKELAQKEFDVNRVARAVSIDVALSYRLLRFLNSPYFSFMEKISSIPHAVSILGEEPFRQWLTIAMVMEMRTSAKAQVIVRIALHRARFFQTLATSGGRRHDPKALFLLGLFSKLDALLGMPMDEITGQLPLSQDLVAALNQRRGPFGDWLSFAEYVEEADWAGAQALLKGMKLDEGEAERAHAESALWVDRLLRASAQAEGGKA